MITINGEKELIRVENWEDIESRPGFDGRLNPVDHELDAIIGSYVFAEKIPCGLSSCRTLHGRGYLVATKDGRLTNIGKDCGRVYFGVDFETMSRQFDKDIAAKENRERLWSFSFKTDEIARSIARIRKGENGARGADWVHKMSRPLLTMNQGCPDAAVWRVRELLKTGSNDVLMQREATKEEAERADALAGRRLPRPHYIEESAGRVAHLDALLTENDLREILVIDLDTNLKAFSDLDIDALSHAKLNQWAKWIGTVDLQLDKATASVQAGLALLAVDNLAPLSALLTKREDISMFRRYLAGLEDVSALSQ